MLNESARAKLENLLLHVVRKRAGLSTYEFTLYDIEWLVITLIEIDNRIKRHQDCCLPIREPCAYRKKKENHLSECYKTMYPKDPNVRCTCLDWSLE